MIQINYSEETINQMSKEQLIDYCETLKRMWSRTIERLDKNIQYCDSLLEENKRIEESHEKDRKYYETNLDAMMKEINNLQEKLKNENVFRKLPW